MFYIKCKCDAWFKFLIEMLICVDKIFVSIFLLQDESKANVCCKFDA